MRPINPKKGLFTIGVAAEMIGVEPRVLRLYEEKGLVQPLRSEGNRRLFSLEDSELLEYVHFMTHVRKVNLAGVKAILELLEKMPEDVRRQEITSIERAIDQLDQATRKIFSRGSKSVQFTLLNERKQDEIQRAAEEELAADDLGLDGLAEDPEAEDGE